MDKGDIKSIAVVLAVVLAIVFGSNMYRMNNLSKELTNERIKASKLEEEVSSFIDDVHELEVKNKALEEKYEELQRDYNDIEDDKTSDDKKNIDWDELYQKAKENDEKQYNEMKEEAAQRASTTQSTTKTNSTSIREQRKYSDQEKIAYSAIFFLIVTVIVLLYKLRQKRDEEIK